MKNSLGCKIFWPDVSEGQTLWWTPLQKRDGWPLFRFSFSCSEKLQSHTKGVDGRRATARRILQYPAGLSSNLSYTEQSENAEPQKRKRWKGDVARTPSSCNIPCGQRCEMGFDSNGFAVFFAPLEIWSDSVLWGKKWLTCVSSTVPLNRTCNSPFSVSKKSKRLFGAQFHRASKLADIRFCTDRPQSK